jgi:hypothetical protein
MSETRSSGLSNLAPSRLGETAAGVRVREQHGTIRSGLRSIEAVLAKLAAASEPGADQAARAIQRLEGLARELRKHFAEEETDNGIFAKALAGAPRLERKVLALRKEHAPLALEVERILQDAGYAGLAPDAWGKVAAKFSAFAQALRHHETAENRLLSDAYLQDLGSGD